MANKLKIYEIEYAGKIYELEAPDGTPEEELFGAIEGYSPEPTSAPAPAAPVTTNPAEPVAQGSYETAEMGVDRWLRQEEAKPLSDEDAQTYLRMTKDPTIPATTISDWLSERGGVWTPQADQELADYRRAIQEGKEVSDFIGYEPLSNTLLDPYTPEIDPGVGDFGAALEEGMAYNPMGMLQRGIEDLFDVEQGGISKDRIRELYPNLSDDAVENVMDGLMGELRRRELANAGFQVDERDVNLPTRIAGNLIGGASPVDVVPLGRGLSVGRRVGEGFAANAALDAAMQAGDIAYGAQDEFRPEQTLQAGAEGAALQGVFEGVAKLAGGVARRIEDRQQVAEDPVSEAPARISVPTARKNSKVYKEQIATTAGEVVDTINTITKDWQNAPEIEVHTNFKDVDGVANDAVGVFTPEGKVLINTEAVLKEAKTVRVSPEDVVSGVLFHESLGHYGLTQQFGDELDDMLDTFYSSGNTEFQSRVDQWLNDNPTAYKNNPNRTRLATEEVLAEWSEAGQLPASIGDRVINFVKKWAREMGIDLSFSEREIRAILGMAHNAVINGKRRDVAANEFKLASPTSAGFNRPKIDDRFRTEDTKLRRANAEKNDPFTTSFDRGEREPLYMRPTKIRDVNVSAADRASLSDAEVNTIADAQYLINRLTEGYEPQQRRSWAESKEEARALGLDNATVKRIQKKGVDQFDTRLFQYDAITNRLTEELAELLPKMNARDMTLARKEKFMTLLTNAQLMYSRVLDETSEVARALNAVKAIQNSKRNLDNLNRVLSEYQDGSGNMLGAFADDEVTMKFATQLQQMLNNGNPAGAALAVRQILKPYWWQYVLSFRHAMMLSGLATHAKNTADNAMMITRNLEEKIMALPGQAVRAGLAKAGKTVKDGVSVEEVAAHSYGLLRALMDSSTYKNAAKSFKEGHGSTPYSAKIEMQDAHIPYVGKVNDFLYAQDTFFRAFHQNANLYALGVRKARQEGFTGRRAFEEGAAKAHNPTPEMIKEADQLSDEALLVDTPSLFSSKLESLKAIRPNMTGAEQTGAFVANILFPFFRVTDRLLFQALRRAGPLAYLDKNTRADLEAGGARRDIAIARATFGGALIWYYWNEAGSEELEGAGDPDYRKRQALEAGGWRPNSVKEGDRYVDATALNLSFLPWDTQNAVAANVASIREAYDRGEDVSEQLGLAAQALMNVLASQSYGENLASYFGPIADTNPDTAGPSWANFVGGQASAFVPAALRQMNQQVVDPVKRDTSGDKSFGDRVAGRIMSGIPGLSDNLPARRDVYGDVIPQGRTTFGMNNYTEIKDDLVSTELTKLEKSTDKTVVVGAPSSFQMESAPDVTTRYGTAKDGKVKLSAEGKQEWQRALGEFLREDMMEWVTSEDWAQMSNEEKIEVVKEVRKAANADAKAYMLELLELTEEE